MYGYTPESAFIFKRFCPRPSNITFKQGDVSTREAERLKILANVKGDLEDASSNLKNWFDKSNHQTQFSIGDQCLTRVQRGVLKNKQLKNPKWK